MSKYQYVINPRIPIRDLVKGESINRETCLMLDLDGVKRCLRHGPVYRKIGNTNELIRVTLNNCLEYHKLLPPETEEVVEETSVIEESAVEPVIPEVIKTEETSKPVVEEAATEPTEGAFEAFGPEDDTDEEPDNSNNNNYRHNRKRRNR